MKCILIRFGKVLRMRKIIINKYIIMPERLELPKICIIITLSLIRIKNMIH